MCHLCIRCESAIRQKAAPEYCKINIQKNFPFFPRIKSREINRYTKIKKAMNVCGPFRKLKFLFCSNFQFLDTFIFMPIHIYTYSIKNYKKKGPTERKIEKEKWKNFSLSRPPSPQKCVFMCDSAGALRSLFPL